jgi:preprotein translocase subunit SecB
VIQSPLILKHYFITNLSIRANPDFANADASVMETSVGSLGTTVEVAKHADNDRLWKVGLKIVCSNSGDSFCAYFVDVELAGFFEIHNSVPDGKVALKLVSANAPAVLFGAARELIMLITGRGPMPPLCLPSVTFADVVPSESPSSSKTEKKELVSSRQ